MQFSHSRIETFVRCKYKYMLQYIDKLETIPDDNADNALYLGTALHTAIETGDILTAISQYYQNYPIVTDDIISQSIMLYWMGLKAINVCPRGLYETPIQDPDFIGFIDLLVPVSENGVLKEFDLYDFKFSNNKSGYMESDQLHLYKYYYEKNNPLHKIRNLYYLFVPKPKTKQIKSEDTQSYRERIMLDCKHLEPEIVKVDYNPSKVIEYLTNVKQCIECTSYLKKHSFLCKYCQFNAFCEKGENYMILPKNERRKNNVTSRKKIWVYGAPFSGKTTFANQFPDPLMLNTDGNVEFVDAPFIPIKDDVHKEGRQTIKKSAWEVFKEVIDELELKDNDFKTIVVDLLEDTYEHCRKYVCDQRGWSHESDDSFKAWDMVRTEFLTTIKRLMNLDYENIVLISHVDTTKDIMKRSGDKITAIKPNIADKVANKVAGMVDIVGRAVAEGDNYVLSFERSEVVFGGGRLQFAEKEIPLSYEEFVKLYGGKNFTAEIHSEEPAKPVEVTDKDAEAVMENEPAKVEEVIEKAENTAEAVNEKPVRRRRRREE